MTKNGYEILADYPKVHYTLIDRKTEFQPFVACWYYNEESDTWAQGHYFDSLTTAFSYIYDLYKEIGATDILHKDERIFI